MHKVLLLPGDGIGPEIMEQGKKLLALFRDFITYEEADIGGIAIDRHGTPYPDKTARLAEGADAVLLSAVGGPKWEALPLATRPETGLLALRKSLNVYANIRPLEIWAELAEFSPLKSEIMEGASFAIVRELTGDLYFGEPRGMTQEKGERRAWNTMTYSESEIRRVAHMAFGMARNRRKKLCSVDKANVLETMVLWREIVTEVHKDYPDVALQHMYVDNAAMQIIRQPADFDVILTPNMFGDILSDEAAVLAGSLGLLPSASLGGRCGLYEPIHGSAPDIARQGKANPIGLILSIAMMMEFTFGKKELAKAVHKAVGAVLQEGFRTPDIHASGMTKCSTDEMGSRVCQAIS
ncbi:MAG: 3-isopropylmalate dehydrogenase [Alphaproteobacteria bacterium]